MNILENLKNYLPSSEKYMSSMLKEHILGKDFKNISESLSSGTFSNLGVLLKLKYIFFKYLQKKIWGEEIFNTKYFKYYKNLCKIQNRLVDFDIIKHAFMSF